MQAPRSITMQQKEEIARDTGQTTAALKTHKGRQEGPSPGKKTWLAQDPRHFPQNDKKKKSTELDDALSTYTSLVQNLPASLPDVNSGSSDEV